MKILDKSSIGKKQPSEVTNHVRDVWSRRYSQTTPDKPRINTNQVHTKHRTDYRNCATQFSINFSTVRGI